jgi:hypothetical protein
MAEGQKPEARGQKSEVRSQKFFFGEVVLVLTSDL